MHSEPLSYRMIWLEVLRYFGVMVLRSAFA